MQWQLFTWWLSLWAATVFIFGGVCYYVGRLNGYDKAFDEMADNVEDAILLGQMDSESGNGMAGPLPDEMG